MMIKREDVIKQLKSDVEFSTMPHIAMQVMDMVEDPELDLKELEEVISVDQVLTAEILKLANSPLYSPRRQIVSLRHALSYLGASVIRSLTIMVSVRSLYSSGREKSYIWSEMWKHASVTAVAARTIAFAIEDKVLNAESVFIMGLLHDFGKVAFMKLYPEIYEDIYEKVSSYESDFVNLELENFGIAHPEVGYIILSEWRLPEAVVDVVRRHHEEPDTPELACISLANIFCSENGYSVVSEEIERKFLKRSLEILKIDDKKWQEMCKNIFSDIEEYISVLGV